MPKRNSNTPKQTKRIFRSLFVGFVAISTFLAATSAAFLSKAPVAVSADETPWTPNEQEKEVERKELAVTAVSSTLTSTTQSLSVKFRSKKIQAWANGAKYTNVFVLPTDEEWTLDKAEAAAKEAAAEAEASGSEVVYPRYEANVYNISYNRNAAGEDKGSIVIPNTITNNKGFIFDVTGISADCCFNRRTGLISYDNLTEIVIPATVKHIEAGAFFDVPENVKIYCEAPEYTEDEEGNEEKTYPEDWTTATPIYGHELTEAQKRKLNVATPQAEPFGSGEDFFLGIVDDEYDLPLRMEYSYEKLIDGVWTPENTVHWQTLPIQAENNPFDAVGTNMGKFDFDLFANISVAANTRVHADSVKFHNIYKAVPGDDGKMVPDIQTGEEWNGEYCAIPTIAYSVVPHFEDFFELRPVSYSTLGDYLQVEVDLVQNRGETGYGYYPTLEPTLFAQNKAALDSGKLSVRYQFSALNQASYRFVLKDGSSLTKNVSTPVKYILLTAATNRTGFLLNVGDIAGLKLEDIASVELSNFTIKSDLYNNETHAIVTKSSISLRFASLPLLNDFAATNHIDVGLIILLAYVGYVVVFVILATAYYFYAKRRFRNDEFRRVNNKRYFLAALKNFIGFATIFSAFLFIYCRWGLLRTTVVVFNPLDAFVTIFAVLGAIFLGFTIKNVVVSVKNARKRKEALRLKLDQDVADDGTK